MLIFSGGCERLEMESGFGHVQAVRRSEPNRPALVGQKEEARNQIEVQQLVAKVQ